MCELSERIDPHNHIVTELRLLKADLHRIQQKADAALLSKVLARLDKLEAYLTQRAENNLVPMKIGHVSITKYGTAGGLYASIIQDTGINDLLKMAENKTKVYVLMPLGERKPADTVEPEQLSRAKPPMVCSNCNIVGKPQDAVVGDWYLWHRVDGETARSYWTCSDKCAGELHYKGAKKHK